jgi:hypothetical protein
MNRHESQIAEDCLLDGQHGAASWA